MLECLKKKMNIQRKTKFHLVRLSRKGIFLGNFLFCQNLNTKFIDYPCEWACCFPLRALAFLGEVLEPVWLQRLAPRGRFGPAAEVKERLQRQALQRLSWLDKALPLFLLLGALAPAGSPVTSLSRRSRVPSAPINSEAIQPKVLQHTFFNLAKCVTIFFIFWQAAVRRACSPAFFNPRNRK